MNRCHEKTGHNDGIAGGGRRPLEVTRFELVRRGFAHVSVWRPVDPQEPTTLRTGGGYDGVDPPSKPFDVGGVRADDDPHMRLACVMTTYKVSAVLRQKDAACRCGVREHCIVIDSLARAPGLLGG